MKASLKRLIELSSEVESLSKSLLDDPNNENLQRKLVKATSLMSRISEDEIAEYEIEKPCEIFEFIRNHTPNTTLIETSTLGELKEKGYFFAQFFRSDGASCKDGRFTGAAGYKPSSNQIFKSDMLHISHDICIDTNYHACQTVAFSNKEKYDNFLKRNGMEKYSKKALN